MKNAWWKTMIGSFSAAVFCVAICSLTFGAEGKSIEEMEKELNALKAAVLNLTEQIETVKQEKLAAAAATPDTQTREDVEALKNEVSTLKEELRTAAQAEPTIKAEDLTGNVYSEFAKRVKLGAQIRTRAEYANGFYNAIDPMIAGASSTARGPAAGTDAEYVLNQTRLWADGDVNEHLRIFIQLQDARVFGGEGTTVGFTDDSANNRMDIHQGYFDVRNLFDLPLTVRVGRQEIIWGDHRVIGNFVWSNLGRVFDGGRFMWDTDAIHAEVFAVTVDEDGFLNATEDNDGNSDESIYAAMLGFKKLLPGALLELMYIQKNDQDNNVNSATIDGFAVAGDGNVVVHDIGARLDGKVPNFEAIDYTLEAHGQFGDYGDQTHRAWAFAGRVGYTMREMPWTPRFGFEYDFASGDSDVDDSTHETFDNLYPTNHWQGNYGFIDLVGWRNMHDFRANIKVVPTSKLTVQFDYHYFLLDEEEDGWYFASGLLAAGRPAGGFTTNDDNLAQEIDLTISYDLYRNVKLLAGYSFFNSEDWITSAGGGGFEDFDTHWGYIQTTVTF
ncbi:MAG: hypothetical protein E3K32_04430 [wastewater metagenome]|nr:hypothetical protein [Candidatus Loosdrechtia aerotolerans]